MAHFQGKLLGYYVAHCHVHEAPHQQFNCRTPMEQNLYVSCSSFGPRHPQSCGYPLLAMEIKHAPSSAACQRLGTLWSYLVAAYRLPSACA